MLSSIASLYQHSRTHCTSNDDRTLLRLRPKQGKHNRCPLSAADRRAFFSVLVQELARALDLITAGVPLNSQQRRLQIRARRHGEHQAQADPPPTPFQAHAHPYHAMISISVNTSKIDRFKLYESPKTGTKYLNLILLNQEDRFGNRMVIQPVSREAHAAGERGEQVGTWKEFGAKAKTPSHRKEASRE